MKTESSFDTVITQHTLQHSVAVCMKTESSFDTVFTATHTATQCCSVCGDRD